MTPCAKEAIADIDQVHIISLCRWQILPRPAAAKQGAAVRVDHLSRAGWQLDLMLRAEGDDG